MAHAPDALRTADNARHVTSTSHLCLSYAGTSLDVFLPKPATCDRKKQSVGGVRRTLSRIQVNRSGSELCKSGSWQSYCLISELRRFRYGGTSHGDYVSFVKHAASSSLVEM